MNIKELTDIVVNIRDNHLQHMKEDIDKMDRKIDKMDGRLWWIFTLIVGTIIAGTIAKVLGAI